MKTRPDECRHPANGLLSWFVRGTLRGAELDWVKDHVDSCGICTAECETLAAETVTTIGGAGWRTPEGANARQGPRWALYATGAILVMGAALGVSGAWRWSSARGDASIPELTPAVYLDLGTGPIRAADPLKSVSLPAGASSIVVSFFVPVSDRSIYTFDLEGPGGNVLVHEEAIRDLDERGRCTYVVPASLLTATGWYTIVVRVATPEGESRLLPYPFEVKPFEAVPAARS